MLEEDELFEEDELKDEVEEDELDDEVEEVEDEVGPGLDNLDGGLFAFFAGGLLSVLPDTGTFFFVPSAGPPSVVPAAASSDAGFFGFFFVP